MPFVNYTLCDITSSATAFALFPILLIFPGYVAGWMLNLFDFRLRVPVTRLILSLPLSVGITPIAIFLLGRFGSVGGIYLFLGIVGLVFAILVIRDAARRRPKLASYQIPSVVFASGLCAIVMISLVDIQSGKQLYYTVVGYDYSTRASIINAISRTGIPPANPSFFPGHPISLTYIYYFWYAICSVVDQLGGRWVDGRTALIASAAWCGLAMMATIGSYLRMRNAEGGQKAWRTGLLGGGLILVSGLDIIPVSLLFFSAPPPNAFSYLGGDLERWNEQITAWMGSILWVPHHVAALIACLTATMLFLWAKNHDSSDKAKSSAIASMAIASSVGLSAYVTLVFAIFWVLWVAVLLYRRQTSCSLPMVSAGIIALMLASPFIADLLQPTGMTDTNLPIMLAVRNFYMAIPWLSSYSPAKSNFLLALLLPISYLFELGFFAIAGLWNVKRIWKPRNEDDFLLVELILILVTLSIGSFVRSTTLASNDLGWRAWLPGQFVLLIWGVDFLNGLKDHGRNLPHPDRVNRPQIFLHPVIILLVIGFVTTIADLGLLRFWPMVVDRKGVAILPNSFSPDLHFGERTFAAREAYDYINQNSPQQSLVQTDPSLVMNIPFGLYSNRAMAISGLAAYGIPNRIFLEMADRIEDIFRQKEWGQIQHLCHQAGLNYLVVSDRDSLWREIPNLSREQQPLFQNDYYAIFPCARAQYSRSAPASQ